MRRAGYLLKLGLITLFVGIIMPSPSGLAATGGALSIHPVAGEDDPDRPWFVYEFSPGTQHQDTLEITNLESETVTLRLYAADATTTKNGGFSLHKFGQENSGVGNWVSLPFEQITLEPNETRQVDFVLTIPEQADVGEHLGGILVENVAPDRVEREGDFQLNVVTRVGVRLYLTVPGAMISRLDLADISLQSEDGQLVLAYHLENKGNIQLQPNLDYQVSSWSKTISSEENVALGSILRGDQVTSQRALTTLRLPGRYEITGTINYGDGQSIPFQTSYLFLPLWSWGVLGGALLALALGGYGISRLIRFLQRVRQLEQQHTRQNQIVHDRVLEESQAEKPEPHQNVIVPPPLAIIERTKTFKTTSTSQTVRSRKKPNPKTKPQTLSKRKTKANFAT